MRVAPGEDGELYGRVVFAPTPAASALRLRDGATVSFSANQVSAVRKRVNAQWQRWRSLSAAALHVHAGLNIAGLAPARSSSSPRRSNGHAMISVTLPAGSRGNPTGGQGGNQSGKQNQSGDQSSDNGAGTGGDAVGTITQFSQSLGDDQRRRPHDDLQL